MKSNIKEIEQRKAIQIVDFKKGNEMAALAAKQINFHIMGYYPITPSTEISGAPSILPVSSSGSPDTMSQARVSSAALAEL